MSKVVLGCGIGGLATTYYLSKLTNHVIQVFETNSKVGGWINSNKSKSGGLFELGPRTMRVIGEAGANTLALIEDLKLQDMIQPVLASQPAARNRMLYVNGQLHKLPNNFTSLFKTLPPFSKPLASAFLQDLKTPSTRLEDDTLYNFVSRRLGHDIAEYAVSALVCGVCAGDAKEISVNLLMSKFMEYEQKHGGIIKGIFASLLSESGKKIERGPLATKAKRENWNVWSLSGGLETLPAALFKTLNGHKNVKILLESRCDGIKFSKAGAEVTVNGKSYTADHVYSSLPAYQIAKILPQEHDLLAKELTAIPYVSVAVVNLEYSGNILPVDGFGFLVPPNQNLPILGVIFDSCCFPQAGKTILTVMLGGHWFEKLFGPSPSDNHLLTIATNEVKKALRITEEPVEAKVSILRNCIPQYIVGHKARVERIQSYILQHNLPLTLTGSSYDGIGVNDVILSARRAVEKSINK